jgi:cytochrome c oxidase subunit 2
VPPKKIILNDRSRILGEKSMPILAKFNAQFARFLSGSKAASLAGVLFGSVVLALTAPGAAHAAAPVPWQMDLQPPAGSLAEMATDLHNLLLVVITLISLFVLGLLIYVGVRFRASRNPNPTKTSHHAVIEILWTVIPVLILVGIAVPSFRLLYYMDRTNETDMVIKVTGNQWYWNYTYPDEGITFDSYMVDEADLKPGQPRLLTVDYPMVVPEGMRIKLLITGNDVMHSFFVPSLAVQIYAFIGRTNEAWIDVPVGSQTYYGQCNQICGVNHAYMPIEVKALPKAEYAAWLAKAKKEFASNDIGPVQPEVILASVK